MVGIVVVSHSDALAEGVVTLAREMGGDRAGARGRGRDRTSRACSGPTPSGCAAAIERAMSADGVLVLMDLGSALMSAELAVELLGGRRRAGAAERRAAGRGDGGGGGGGPRRRVAR